MQREQVLQRQKDYGEQQQPRQQPECTDQEHMEMMLIEGERQARSPKFGNSQQGVVFAPGRNRVPPRRFSR